MEFVYAPVFRRRKNTFQEYPSHAYAQLYPMLHDFPSALLLHFDTCYNTSMETSQGESEQRPITQAEIKSPPVPIADVIIGKVDPRTLSREKFDKSPELLFHGTGERNFIFRRDLDYGSFDRPVSATIGEGFYCTDNRRDAEIFSQVRQVSDEAEPFVINLLPHQARMLDLRSTVDPKRNAPVPIELFNAWRAYYKGYVDSLYPPSYNPQEDIDLINSTNATSGGEERIKRVNRFWFYNTNQNYLRILEDLSSKNEPIELRQMLSVLGQSSASEFAATKFRDFMLAQGYDGLIYIEGGDRSDQRNPTSYVFYNLEKIGAFETWHSEEK